MQVIKRGPTNELSTNSTKLYLLKTQEKVWGMITCQASSLLFHKSNQVSNLQPAPYKANVDSRRLLGHGIVGVIGEIQDSLLLVIKF